MKTKTNYTENHNTFAGEIDIEDFSTSSPNKKRINKYETANKFYDELSEKKKNIEQEKQYKTMTLEELKEMRLISNTNGRPSSSLTDEKWQKEFNIRKLFVKPVNKEFTKLGQKCLMSKESGYWNEETMGTYHGATNWQEYYSYINDILSNIRAGQFDYCYFIYQIMDLAKFHYDNLKTKYCDGYWRVWLDK